MKHNIFMAMAFTSALMLGGLTSCYDLTELGDDPYALPNDNVNNGGNKPVDPIGEYGDIDISYEVTDATELSESRMTWRPHRLHSVISSMKVTTMTIRLPLI